MSLSSPNDQPPTSQPPASVSPAPVAAPILTRMVVFDPATGQPVVQTVPMFDKQQVADIIIAAATELYDADPGLEPQYVGMTNLEVMIKKRQKRAALTGNTDEVESLLDRMIGRPKSISESKTFSMTYEDKLKDIERQEGLRADAATPVHSYESGVIDNSPLADLL